MSSGSDVSTRGRRRDRARRTLLIALLVLVLLLTLGLYLWKSGAFGKSGLTAAESAASAPVQPSSAWRSGGQAAWSVAPNLSGDFTGQFAASKDVAVVVDSEGNAVSYRIGKGSAEQQWTAKFAPQPDAAVSAVIFGNYLMVDGEPHDLRTGKPAQSAPLTAAHVVGQAAFDQAYVLCTADQVCSFYDHELDRIWQTRVDDVSGILRAVRLDGDEYALRLLDNAWSAVNVVTGEDTPLAVPPGSQLGSTVRDGWVFNADDMTVLARPDGTREAGRIDWAPTGDARFAFTPGSGQSTVADVAYIYFGTEAGAPENQIRGVLDRDACSLEVRGAQLRIGTGPAGCYLWGNATSPDGRLLAADGPNGLLLLDLRGGSVETLSPSAGKFVAPELFVAWDYQSSSLVGLVPAK